VSLEWLAYSVVVVHRNTVHTFALMVVQLMPIPSCIYTAGERPQMPLPGVQPVGVTNSPTLLTSPTHHHRLGERSSTLPQSSRYGNQAPPTSPPGGDRFSGKKQVLAPLRSRASYTHEFAVSTTPQVHFQLDTQRKRSESLNTHGKLF
jgi:hypothetical protein